MEEFSSWRSKTGKKINVVAPDDFSDSDNKYLNGTNFSAPAVAGIVSVLMEIEKDIYERV
ncbi:hypothetical protein RRG58_06475 [Mycoplasmopsis cynos]|nr:hypothetical protein [Mycoplasmopsis felis]WQQ11318.1 hypothetical protein RRG50_02605 [Mycoplasmopsis felis]